MKIAIINDVHLGEALEWSNKIRAASHLAKETLPVLIDHIQALHQPDVLINLGDLIRRKDASDLERYKEAISCFKRASCPVIHLLGNHELKNISIEEIEQVWHQSGFTQNSYGYRKIKGVTLIWLGLELHPERTIHQRLPDHQLAWLTTLLEKTKSPTILFTHCAIDHQDVTGNFFYEGWANKNTHGFFLENAEAIQRVISGNPHVEMVVQAHLHYFHAKVIGKVPYVTCPAMGDNICAPQVREHMPEIYSVLTINPAQLVLKAYSRDYCFAGIEWERT